jgi:hypothetical protein
VASTNVVGSQAAMLALSNATVGSIAVRTDLNKNFILSTAGPSVLANWIEAGSGCACTSGAQQNRAAKVILQSASKVVFKRATDTRYQNNNMLSLSHFT